jgi:hypothetical protein
MHGAFDLWIPTRKLLTPLYYAEWPKIPDTGIARLVACAFPAVGPLETKYASIQLHPAFLGRAIVGYSPEGEEAGRIHFNLQIFHITPSGQRQLFSTGVDDAIAVGTAGHPANLIEPELFALNDSIRFQVKNCSATANNDIYVGVWGADVQL